MDGAYISDSAIINGPTYAFEYSTTNISCNYPQRAIGRNKDKRDILEYLFPTFLESDVVNGVPNNMGASWRYIKEGLHSLERHTNLHIYFKTHPNPDEKLTNEDSLYDL